MAMTANTIAFADMKSAAENPLICLILPGNVGRTLKLEPQCLAEGLPAP